MQRKVEQHIDAAQRYTRHDNKPAKPQEGAAMAELGQLNSMLHVVDSELAMKKLKHNQPAQGTGQGQERAAASPHSAHASFSPVVAEPEPAVSAGHVRVQIPAGAKPGQLMEVTLPGVTSPVSFTVPALAQGI